MEDQHRHVIQSADRYLFVVIFDRKRDTLWWKVVSNVVFVEMKTLPLLAGAIALNGPKMDQFQFLFYCLAATMEQRRDEYNDAKYSSTLATDSFLCSSASSI